MRLAARLFASVLLLLIAVPVSAVFADPLESFSVTLQGTEVAGVADNSLVVTALADGIPDPTYMGTVTFSSSDTGGDTSLPGDYTFTGGDAGVHHFDVTFTKSGPQTITATDNVDGTITGTGNTTVDAATAFSIDMSGTSSGDLSSGSTRDVTALVEDAFDNPVVGQSVSFAQTGGPGTVTGTGSISTDATGTAIDTVTGVLAGSVTITGTTADAGTDTVMFPVVAGTPANLGLTGLTTNLGSGSTRQLTATVTDAAGNGISGDLVTLMPSGAGTVTGLTDPITNSSGVATDTVTGALVGTVTITATDGNSLTDNLSFNVIPGAPFHIAVTGGTTSLTSGLTRQLTATLTDSAGNPIPGQPITFSKSAGSGSGTVSGFTSPTTNSLGVVNDTVTGVLAGPITITAVDGGVNGQISFTVVPGAPLHLVLSGATTSLTSGTGRILTATVTDAAGNGIPGETVTLSQTGTITGTVGGLTTASTGISGAVNETATGVHAGSVSIVATDGGLTSNTVTFAVIPGTASSLIVSGLSTNLASGATRGVTATVTDLNGNGVAGEQVIFTASTPPGSVNGLTSPTTGASGVVTDTVTGVLAGSVTVTATDGGLTDDLTFTVTAGATNHITLSPSTASMNPGSSQSYTTTAFDNAGNSTDVTGTANLLIAGGTCDLTSCSAVSVGAHTVTSSYSGKTATATLTILNLAPTAVPDSMSTNEDSSSKEFDVLGNDTDPNLDTLTVTAVSTPSHGVVTIDNLGAGIHYTPTPHYNGPDSFDYSIADGHGGVDTTTVTVTVNHVNEVPFFTKGANQTVLENSSPGPVSGWATGMSPGLDPTESGQALTFIVSSDNPGLFSAGPAVDSSGNLTYTPAANTSGVANVSVQIHDDGGTALGGVDTSLPQSFTITVTFVNQAPSFTKGADQAILEDAGPISVPGWASAISSGPGDPTQTLNFIVTNNNNALFTVTGQPAINAAGLLTYTTAPNANGSATVSVSIHDNGGVANGGVDTSAVQTFAIAVTPVNDAPTFVKGANVTLPEEPGPVTHTVTGWATGFNPGGGPDEAGQTVLAYIVTNDHHNLFSTQPAISPNGNLTYELAASRNGTATVSVAVQDNGGTANGGVDTSAIQTFTITIAGVDHAPAAITDSANVVQGSGPTSIDVLANDFDPDLDPLSIVAVCSSATPFPCYQSFTTPRGRAAVSADRKSVTYDPTGSLTGSDQFQYEITDGRGAFAFASVLITIVPDTFAPVASAPVLTSIATTATTVTVMIRWSGTDVGLGIKSYQLQVSHNGGAYTTVTTAAGATSVQQVVTNGTTYTYRVRATDLANNVGAYAISDPFVPARVPRPAPPTRRHGSVTLIEVSAQAATSRRGATITIVQP